MIREQAFSLPRKKRQQLKLTFIWCLVIGFQSPAYPMERTIMTNVMLIIPKIPQFCYLFPKGYYAAIQKQKRAVEHFKGHSSQDQRTKKCILTPGRHLVFICIFSNFCFTFWREQDKKNAREKARTGLSGQLNKTCRGVLDTQKLSQ